MSIFQLELHATGFAERCEVLDIHFDRTFLFHRDCFGSAALLLQVVDHGFAALAAESGIEGGLASWVC
ncbi:hypothetical protein N9260_01760 [bacterium]|nr:hypothetical protein [bacterium]